MNPCGDDFVCGQPTLGPEMIINGTFATNLDNWTADAGWTWSAASACNDGSPNAIRQTIAGLTNGADYRVSFEILNYTSGNLAVLLGNTLYAPDFSANGVYAVTITAGAGTDIEFDSDAAFIGCIVNVSVRPIQECWHTSFGGDDPFTFTDTSVCIAGSGTLFTDTLTNGPGYYVASFTISNYTSGSVLVKGACTDTWVGGPFSANGEKFAYGVFAGPGVLCFDFTNFFGCISEVHLHRLYIP